MTERLREAAMAALEAYNAHDGMLLSQRMRALESAARAVTSDNTTVAAAGPGVMPGVGAEPSSHQATVGGSRPSGYHQLTALVAALLLLRRVRDRGDPVQFFEANAVMGMIEAALEPPTNSGGKPCAHDWQATPDGARICVECNTEEPPPARGTV